MSDAASTPRPEVARRTALRHGLVATGTLAWSVPAVQALATTVASAQATSVVAPGPGEPTSGPSSTSATATPSATQPPAQTTTSASAPSGTSTSSTTSSTSTTAGEPVTTPTSSTTSTTASNPGSTSGGRRSGTSGGSKDGEGTNGGGTGAGPGSPTGPRAKTTVAALVVFFEWKGSVYGAKLLKSDGIQPLRGRDTWMVPPGSPQWQPWQGGGKGGRDGDRRGLWVRLPKNSTLRGASALLHNGEVYSRYPASVTGGKVHCRDLT